MAASVGGVALMAHLSPSWALDALEDLIGVPSLELQLKVVGRMIAEAPAPREIPSWPRLERQLAADLQASATSLAMRHEESQLQHLLASQRYQGMPGSLLAYNPATQDYVALQGRRVLDDAGLAAPAAVRTLTSWVAEDGRVLRAPKGP